LAADPDNERAEFAVIVRSDQHGRGIGQALMEQLIEYSKSEGIGVLYGDVMRWNNSMLKLCRNLGFTERINPDDIELVRFEMVTGPAS
jgi:acetyltransferase